LTILSTRKCVSIRTEYYSRHKHFHYYDAARRGFSETAELGLMSIEGASLCRPTALSGVSGSPSWSKITRWTKCCNLVCRTSHYAAFPQRTWDL